MKFLEMKGYYHRKGFAKIIDEQYYFNTSFKSNYYFLKRMSFSC